MAAQRGKPRIWLKHSRMKAWVKQQTKTVSAAVSAASGRFRAEQQYRDL
jgi:hypothetical protein